MHCLTYVWLYKLEHEFLMLHVWSVQAELHNNGIKTVENNVAATLRVLFWVVRELDFWTLALLWQVQRSL